MKKSLLTLLLFMGVGVFLLLAGCDNGGYKDEVKNYVKEKYDFDINLIDSPSANQANLGNINVTVERKDMPGLTFQVFLKGGFIRVNISGDSYKQGYEFYQFKQKVMPNVQQQIKVIGFDYSNLQQVIHRENGADREKTAELYLFKSRGLTANEKDFQMTAAALPVMKGIQQQLKQLGYQFDTVINSNAYAAYKNVFDYSKAGAISKQIEISDLDKMNNEDDVKKYLFNDDTDSEKLIHDYYFRKDSGKIEAVRKQLNPLGMDVPSNNSYLGCEDSPTDFIYQELHVNKCNYYSLEVTINKPIKMLNNNTEINKIAQAVYIVESTKLPIDTMTIHTTDKDICLENLDFVSDKKELVNLIKDEIEQK